MCTVLIVDDDPDIRNLIGIAASESGHDVVKAGDLEEALKAAEISAPDVISLDLELPGANGVEILKRLREEGLSSFAVIVSAHVGEISEQLKDLWHDLRVFACMEKPFRLDNLVHTLEDAAEVTPETEATSN
jgi:DNA-binding NtrC family response regulator